MLALRRLVCRIVGHRWSAPFHSRIERLAHVCTRCGYGTGVNEWWVTPTEAKEIDRRTIERKR